MSDENASLTDSFLKHPEVKKATDCINSALTERLEFVPPLCKVFESSYTRLKAKPEHIFQIHPSAREKLPDIINNPVQGIKGGPEPTDSEKPWNRRLNVGIVFSGGPAPGGHNVIAGLFDALGKTNPDSRLFGFLLGPEGILENNCIEISREKVNAFRNLGGFTMIGTGRTKIDTPEKMQRARKTCRSLNLDALIIVGGDDSNTNAAFLAQELYNDGIQVIGVPKTIDGDIQVRDKNNELLCAVSFGFHTAARAFSHNISNLCADCSSDVKYWHVCKVMGRVASHLALETALQVHPNITLIGEEIADFIDEERINKAEQQGSVDYTAYGMTLRHVSRLICDGIVRRAAAGKNYGVIVMPEGLLEFINEIQVFIIKLNTIIADYNETHDTDFHSNFPTLDEKLDYLRRMARMARENHTFSVWNTRDDDLFNVLPPFFQEGLLTERDSHGNFQFSQVETDKVIMGLVKDYLKILEERGTYKVGIERKWYLRTMENSGLDPEIYGPALFKNFNSDEPFLLVNESVVSVKTLKQTLVKEGVIDNEDDVPGAVEKIYKASVPKFKTQNHFYGYDGRGNDPTWFDCTYTYNLGRTVFSLIAGGSTGQMAAIKNLEKTFEQWEPIGIPIAPLMHLEERKGKLSLVLEKALVDIESPAFRVFSAMRGQWLAAHPGRDHYRRPGPIRYSGQSEDARPITLVLNELGRAE
ncbi:MAG: 6-phosphofructokinase [Desulfobacteraceae bacterium]|nr:6-phosphofructokinase [Desulfobacteraceae bacterium]